MFWRLPNELKGGTAEMMRKKCSGCERHTYLINFEAPSLCIYCGKDLTEQPLLPLGNFKPDDDPDVSRGLSNQ